MNKISVVNSNQVGLFCFNNETKNGIDIDKSICIFCNKIAIKALIIHIIIFFYERQSI